MEKLKKLWWKALLLIILFACMNMVMHNVLSPVESSNISIGEASIFVKQGILIPAIICWELLAFGVFTMLFCLIEGKLPGKKKTKGIIYGISFGILYFIGMFEACLLTDSSVYSEFFMGLTDCLSIIVMGLLLGIFLGSDSNTKFVSRNLISIVVIATFYTIGRYFSYTVLSINSTYSTKSLGTLIWTIAMGVWVGVIYNLLASGIKGGTLLTKALYFGFIYGLNWIINHVFIYTVLEFSWDLLIRSGADVIYLIIGAYVFSKITLAAEKVKAAV